MIAALTLVAASAAASAATIPAAWQGQWAREGGHCTAGVQMEGILTVQSRQIVHGEEQMQVLSLRRAARSSLAVDSRNTLDEDAYWTATTLLTLSEAGRRLQFDQTRRDGRRLSPRTAENYRRCP